MSYSLDLFIDKCRKVVKNSKCPADCVEKITPFMHELLAGDKSFLKPEHFKSDPSQYCRNAIYIDPENTLSLFALVWLPGQWTPIHDHGTWGVVGVLEGAIQERNYIRVDQEKRDSLENVELVRGGSIILTPGSVTSFVPNPDHIHITGNATEETIVSLHLYGHAMSGFHIYDLEEGSREWIEVAHN